MLPDLFALDGNVRGNIIRKLSAASETVVVQAGPGKWQTGLRSSGAAVLVLKNRPKVEPDAETLIVGKSGVSRWYAPAAVWPEGELLSEAEARCAAVRTSWVGRFHFRRDDGTSPLRPPQIGALHAAIAHWTMTEKPATIVLPTGTGKTETMLALLVSERPDRVLVIVPTNPLREQTAQKFITLGLLKKLGVVDAEADYPVVGIQEHIFSTADEAVDFARRCNVVVTSMKVLSLCAPEVLEAFASSFSHLFIDEAHHIAAPSWEAFRERFKNKPVLQFTATPFRNDGKAVDGKVIYNYPLRKSQEEGYFRTINFSPVREYHPQRVDDKIAREAIRQLDEDIAKGFDHIVMARAANIRRATEIVDLYRRYASGYSPVLIHSDLSDKKRREAILAIRQRDSRIVVCVDMLGEGFDLPQLKIAALHDIHRSLAITLQFTGRFTRPAEHIGDATVIANVADRRVEESLRDLYAEDSDWNHLLRRLSTNATERQEKRMTFLTGFRDVPDAISIQNLYPPMSAVVYRTTCTQWEPEKIADVVKPARLYAGPAVHDKEHLAVFVTREESAVSWGDQRDLLEIHWDLFVLYWDKERGLLFVNSSDKDSFHGEIARAVAGDDADVVSGEVVFRTLGGINRLMLMNLGLKHTLRGFIDFTMYAGANIKPGLTASQGKNKIKSNVFGRGYEAGNRASGGCSYRGRIWSHRKADDLSEWKAWCDATATKLLDDTISTKDIFDGVLYPETVTERPALVPIAVEWPSGLLEYSEHLVQIEIGASSTELVDVGIDLTAHTATGPLRFRVFNEDVHSEYEVQFSSSGVTYALVGGEPGTVVYRNKREPLSEFFAAHPPQFRFENGSLMEHDLVVKLHGPQPPLFDRELIEVWEWTGVDLKKESQTVARHADSIQRRVIERVLADPLEFDIVFDDDASNEVADIVAMKAEGDELIVHFYHCKYSSELEPGGRIEDLYVVCGQAQKSETRAEDVEALFDHFFARDASRLEKHGTGRFERGDVAALNQLAQRSRLLVPKFRMFIVQPGLSKQKASDAQLTLLAVTELFLKETLAIPLSVVGSA